MEGSAQNSFTGAGQGLVIYWRNSTLASNTTWNVSDRNAVLYVSSVTVRGVLNIQPGVVIKGAAHWNNNGIVIEQGGTFSAIGNSNLPVTFTSIKDDSVKGDSAGDGSTTPAQADYPVAVSVKSGASVTIDHAIMRYAADTFQVYGGALQAMNLQISNATDALYASSGEINMQGSVANVYNGLYVEGTAKAIMRGSITNASNKAILACRWDQSCYVDASYVDWGNASGPFSTNGNKACGKVAVSPWLVGSSTQGGDVFQVRDCSNPASPSDGLSSTIQSYENRISPKKIDCSYGIQDACDQVNRMLACVNAAASLAMYNSPFTAPGSSPSQDAQTYAQDLTSSASTYLNATANPAPVTFTTDFFDKLIGVMNIWSSLSNAYSSCN